MQEYNFKVWHDEDTTFHIERLLDFSLCGADKNIHLHELLKITSDAAIEDYSERNMGRQVLADNGVAILVSRSSFRFHKLPKEGDTIRIDTWEEKSEPLQLVRAYEITDIDGNPLVSGISGWIVVDVNVRRIMPSKRFTLRPEPVLSREHDCLPYAKISVSEEMAEKEVLLGERVVGRSDLDANGHTNNARYISFAVDLLPDNYASKKWTDFRINYSKEAMLGQSLKIFGYFDDSAKKITVIGKTDGGISFESELFYE